MKPRTILLVEDDRAFLDMLADAIESLGHEVVAAEGGEEALARAEEHEGPIDLVVTDLVMPGMPGHEFAERIRAVRPGLGVLYISGLTEQNVKQEGLLPDGAPFLHKPFDLDDFFDLVRGLVGSDAANDAHARV